MPGELGAGLYLKSGGTVWHVRRRVPEDLRAQFGHEFKASLKTADIDLARARRDAWWAERDRDIELARASGAAAVASVADVLQAIERWREAACLEAARMKMPPPPPRSPTFIKLEDGSLAERKAWSPQARFLAMQDHPWEMVNAVASAEAYFADHPDMSFEPSLPVETAWRLERLEAVARGEGDWRHVEDFDAKLDLALSLTKLTAFLLPQVRDAVRPRFAAAWAEVIRHEELQRRRAALVLAANDAVWARPSDVRAPPTFTGYVPRLGDKTLREVIALARTEKARGKSPEAGEAFVRKNYEHVFRALEELIGEGTPIRALQREDVRELRTLFERLPPNVTKIYRSMPLMEAADRAEAEGREPMAPNTARSYMVNLSALCNLAIAEGWLEKNPCDGLIPGRRDSVRRRGFTSQELTRIFTSLEGERYSDRWWVLVILAYSGARASEVCQLQTGDVKVEQGLPFFDFSVFDVAGVRSDGKRLKTNSSDRAAPLHPELIRVGLLDLVDAQRAGARDAQFPARVPPSGPSRKPRRRHHRRPRRLGAQERRREVRQSRSYPGQHRAYYQDRAGRLPSLIS